MAGKTTMKAVDVKDGKGPPSALFINDAVPRPEPKEGECLVRVKAFGLNRADTWQRAGHYPPPAGVTKTMGLEFSGVVEEVGPGTDAGHTWKKGDEVFGLAYGGAYAEYIAVSKKMLVHKPAQLSWEVCAGVPEVWMTALQALYLVGGLSERPVQSVLWHAGASSVSLAGMQLSLADASAPRVYATARQDDKCAFIKDKIGAHGAINTTSHPGSGWVEEIKKLNDGNGVDLVVDYTGAGYFGANLEVMNRDARMVILALLGGNVLPEGINIGPFLSKRLRVEGSTLRSRDLDYQRSLRDRFESLVLPHLIDGKFECHVDEVLDWTEIGRAHARLENNETKGKLVCTIPWSN